MFQIHKKPQGDAAIKKSTQKLLDYKKDVVTRLKHLKNVLENASDSTEIAAVFEHYHSHIFFIFFENFLLIESNVRQKGAHRSQREELHSILDILEHILIYLPDLINQRWQYNSIETVLKKVLNPQNSLKIRKEAIRLFILWLQALQENVCESTLILYACLVPGFPAPESSWNHNCSLEFLLNYPNDETSGVFPVENTCFVPAPTGEVQPPDVTKYFLDVILECMVKQAMVLQWKKKTDAYLKSFTFLWDLFKKYYLPYIFDDFRKDTSLYKPNLNLPEPRTPYSYVKCLSENGTANEFIELTPDCMMLPARVSVIKWIIVFVSNAIKVERKSRASSMSDSVSVQTDLENKIGASPSSALSQEVDNSHSNMSTLTEKDTTHSVSSLSSLDDKLQAKLGSFGEEDLVRTVLYSTRANINIIHEIFRQAFILPLTEDPTMRKVIKVYHEWIQDQDLPIFMQEPDLNASFSSDASESDTGLNLKASSSASLRNASYMRGQLNSLMETAVQAGCQTTYQLFVTNSANVFLIETPHDADTLVQSQVDICKRVLNLYRHMVMDVAMDDVTWTQLLQVLLHVTRIMLQNENEIGAAKTPVAKRLASPVFQTLIVSWIKANLFVHVSRELWDELVDVLSSLSHWKELIVEWAKNMETMTRVLARHVYGLELSDLPLDRLTEQKQKKKGKSSTALTNDERTSEPHRPPERTFSRGYSKDGSQRPSLPQTRGRTKSALISATSSCINEDAKSPASGSSGSIVSNNSLTAPNNFTSRPRSSTVLGVENIPTLSEHDSLSGNSGNHTSLIRGRSDTTSLTSPTSEVNYGSGNLSASLRNDNLYRSSSTSDISKSNEATQDFKLHKHETRTRCNSGPNNQENSNTEQEVMSLSCVEDTLNDKFDELIQQRLKTTVEENLLADNWPVGGSDRMQSDTVSIDTNWNPWPSNDSDSIFTKNIESDPLTPSSDKDLLPFEAKDTSGTISQRSSLSSLQYDPVNTEYLLFTTSSDTPVTINTPCTNVMRQMSACATLSRSRHKSDSTFRRIRRSTSLLTQKTRHLSFNPPIASTPVILYKRSSIQRSKTSTLTRPAKLLLPSLLHPNMSQVNKRGMSINPFTNVGDAHSSSQPNSDANISLPKPKRVSMLSQKKNSSSETSSPLYQRNKTARQDRNDATTLLLPDLATEASLMNIDEDECDHDDGVILERSSDDILNMENDSSQLVEDDYKSDQNTPTSFGANNTDSLLTPSEDMSILAGGKRTGWYADVAVALWKRILGVLGDINDISDPDVHKLVFTYLLKFLEVLFRMRDNLGITTDNQTTPPPPGLVPPVRIMSPWAFKAVLSLPDSHKSGKSQAYKLLCQTTLQKHDIRLEPDHLALFYLTLHKGLHSTDQDEVNDIVRNCCPLFFSSELPGSTLLLLDFIYACHTVAASSVMEAPREEAQSILGSILCLPNLYKDLPVLKPSSPEPCVIICNNVKEYVADALLTSGKKEPSAPARCISLSSLGIWLYEELTAAVFLSEDDDESASTEKNTSPTHLHFSSPTQGRSKSYHSRVKEAINVLLVSLKFNNRTVACVACSQLHLLTHCVDKLLQFIPEMPARIIEVMSLSLSALLQNTDAKSTDGGRKLLVLLLLCLSDWCMAVPLTVLTETTGVDHEKKLIRTVFKALQTGALGKPGHSAKHSYSLSDLASTDFDPHLPLDKVQEGNRASASNLPNTPQSRMLSKLGLPPLPNVVLGQQNVVSLTASTVLSHLTNHLGHFPMGRGPAILNSMVTEQHDHGTPDEIASYDLSPDLFTSPNVQFLIYNDTCLMSVVEIPCKTIDREDVLCPDSTVRLIVRDTCGKFCWDADLMYGKNHNANDQHTVSITPLESLNKEISEIVLTHCKKYIDYVKEEGSLSGKVVKTDIPNFKGEQENINKLDQLLGYMAYSSPECQTQPGNPLNIPSIQPTIFGESTSLLDSTTTMLINQHQSESNHFASNTSHDKFQCEAISPKKYSPPNSLFHLSRVLCSQSGFLAKENRRRLNLLKKNERLLRELKNLDSRHCRETHKVAVLYIASGQEDKLSILSNTAGSKEFESFINQLGWEIDLKIHSGFRGKLQNDGSAGLSAPYYATSSLEVLFHVSTRFPSTDNDSRNIKLKHLGNDEVHIIWSEHYRDYRRGIIPTEFGDVLIIIYPMHHGLYRIQIQKKPDVPFFGPLFDGAIINKRILPILVRETAINAGRAKRSQIYLYQPYYEERAKYLRQIVEHYKEDTTYENFVTNLFQPAQGNRDLSASSSANSITSRKKPADLSLTTTMPEKTIESLSSNNVQSNTSVNIATALNSSPTPSTGSFGRSNSNNNNSSESMFRGIDDNLSSLPDSKSSSNLSISTINQHRRHSDFASHTLHKLESIAKPRPKPSNSIPSGANKIHLTVPSAPQRNISDPNLPSSAIKTIHNKKKPSPTVRHLPSPPNSPPSSKKTDFFTGVSKLPYHSIAE